MTCSEVVNEIDQLLSEAADAFGKDSDTYRSLRAAYKVAEREAKEIAEPEGLSDVEEYAAAHAHQTFAAAKSINSGR